MGSDHELRRGEYLRFSTVRSPSGRYVLGNWTIGGTSLVDGSTGMSVWKAPAGKGYETGALVLGLDGDLFLELYGPGPVWSAGTAGSGAERLRVTDDGLVVLHDHGGDVVWSSDREPGPDPFPHPAPATPVKNSHRQWDLKILFGSLAPARGYTVAVVQDVTPEQALRRWGLDAGGTVSATWPQIVRRVREDRRDDIPVAAVPLGNHTLLVAGAPHLPGDMLSEGTTVVRESKEPGYAFDTEWSMHVDGSTVAHLRERVPIRRIGMSRPDLLEAAEAIQPTPGERRNADWEANFAGLELLCQMSGVVPTAADLNGVVLGGLVPATTARPPEEPVRVPPPGRPPVPLHDDLLLVRTDYSDDQAWAALLDEVTADEIFDLIELEPVDDPGWDGGTVDEVVAALPVVGHTDVVFLADAEAMTGEGHPLLAVNRGLPPAGEFYEPEEGVSRTFRVAATEVWAVAVNLADANLDWDDFQRAAERGGGVYRG